MTVMVRHRKKSVHDEVDVTMPNGLDAPEGGVKSTGMDQPRMMQVQEIRERIERDDYHVDAGAVAAAILDRLCDGRAMPKAVHKPR
jgi:hypothetical protein